MCATGYGIRRSKDLRAESRKYLISTNERKTMSTKTLRKRIALVAATALGAGLLTVVAVPSANAADTGDFTFTGTGLLGSVTTGSSTTQTATLLTTGSLVVTTTGGDNGYFVVSAGGTITSATAGGGSFATGDGISADQKKFLAGTATDTFTVVPTGAAGSTFTITGYTGIATGVVTDVLTVTIAATSAYGVADPAKSTLSWVANAGASTSDVVDKNQTTYTNGLYLNIQLNDAYGNDITSTSGALVATVTSGATVVFGATGAASISTAGTYTQAVSNANPSSVNLMIKEATAGTGWSGTVTVTYNGVTIGTKSGKITGAPASLLVSPVYINKPDSTANVTWVYYVKDAAGNELSATAANIVLSSSSDKSVISAAVGATDTDPADTTNDAAHTPGDGKTYGAGSTTCLKAGSSKVVMQITTNGNVVKSNEFTQLCGGKAYSYTAALDKASYVQGEIATLTVTFKDVAGNLANSLQAVDTYTNADGATAGVTDAVISAPMMKIVGSSSSLYVEDGIFVGKAGTLTYKFTVGTDLGITEGSYNMVVSFPSIDDPATVAYKVSTGSTGVTNADVLKAIVSLIASINKQIAALQKALLKKK